MILWDLEHPELYEVKTELICDGKLMDERIDRIGFRRAEFKKDGFYLNGKKIKLRGLNRHQSYPYVGYAMPKSMQRLDADILKRELGVNAVRTSHYPQSHYFIERCDEIGLLVFTEIPGWQHIGDAAWKDQACAHKAVCSGNQYFHFVFLLILFNASSTQSLDFPPHKIFQIICLFKLFISGRFMKKSFASPMMVYQILSALCIPSF